MSVIVSWSGRQH